MSLALKIILAFLALVILMAGVVCIAVLIVALVYLKTGGDMSVDIDLKDWKND